MTTLNNVPSLNKPEESLTSSMVEQVFNQAENFLLKESGIIVRSLWRYSCRNCRTPLFCEKDIIDHSKDKPIINFVEKSEDGKKDRADVKHGLCS